MIRRDLQKSMTFWNAHRKQLAVPSMGEYLPRVAVDTQHADDFTILQRVECVLAIEHFGMFVSGQSWFLPDKKALCELHGFL